MQKKLSLCVLRDINVFWEKYLNRDGYKEENKFEMWSV